MNGKYKVYFPFQFHGMYLEIEGETSYPDFEIKIQSVIDTDAEVDFLPKFIQKLETDHQDELYRAWIDWEC